MRRGVTNDIMRDTYFASHTPTRVICVPFSANSKNSLYMEWYEKDFDSFSKDVLVSNVHGCANSQGVFESYRKSSRPDFGSMDDP